MVSEKKLRMVKDLAKDMSSYRVVGLLDMHKLPARQLQEIRDRLRGKARIMMVRKSVMKRAIETLDMKGIKELETHIRHEPALLLSNADPFELARTIDSSKSPAPARAGDLAPHDIVIKAGKTSLKAGPVIGELQRAKIQAGVEGDSITIRKDSLVAKEGEEIKQNVADILMKLGIEPMEIGLNIVCAWEDGLVFSRDLLSISLEKYREEIAAASARAFSLSVGIGYITKQNAPMLLGKAHREALAIADRAGILTKYNVGSLLAKGQAQMESLRGKVNLEHHHEHDSHHHKTEETI